MTFSYELHPFQWNANSWEPDAQAWALLLCRACDHARLLHDAGYVVHGPVEYLPPKPSDTRKRWP